MSGFFAVWFLRFSSVRFRVRPFFSPLSSLFFLLSSLGVGPGSSSPLLCVCPQDADASDRQVGAGHAAFSILSFLVFSLCPGRLPSPSLLLLSLSLSLSFSLACIQSVTVNSLDCNEASSWTQSRAVLRNLQLIGRRGRNKVSGGDSAEVPFRVLSVCSVGNADGNRQQCDTFLACVILHGLWRCGPLYERSVSDDFRIARSGCGFQSCMIRLWITCAEKLGFHSRCMQLGSWMQSREVCGPYHLEEGRVVTRLP